MFICATTREALEELLPSSLIICIPTDTWDERNLEGLDGRQFKNPQKKKKMHPQADPTKQHHKDHVLKYFTGSISYGTVTGSIYC